MKKRIFSIFLTLCMALSLLPATVLAAEDEQFELTPGETYYFNLSGENIPGKVNSNLPDRSLHYVPFTYTGTIEAYKLTSEMRTTEAYAQQNKYAHSLFVANHGITHTVSWNNLDSVGLIFGKDYASGSVNYTLRAPSAGSRGTGSGGTPTNNEWDMILNKNSDYIQNWSEMYSFGQDTVAFSTVYCSFRGYDSNRAWNYQEYVYKKKTLGFRPVLEVLNSNALGSDGLKTVTLDLNGGTLGGSSDDIQIIVKNNSTFTAPAAEGLTAPTGYGAANSKWLDDNGNTYAPGDSVPAGVTRLTAQWHDIVAPSIAGLTDGQTYCSAVEFTTSDNDGIASVTVNGTTIQAVNGKYTLTPAQGEQVVKVSDNAGNSVTVTVIVNDGHTPEADDGNCTTEVVCGVCGFVVKAAEREHNWGVWQHQVTSHARQCQNPGCGVTKTENCSGGTATCTEQATCDVCHEKYGALNPDNHTGTAVWIPTTATHVKKYNCCDAIEVAEAAHHWENGVCTECSYGCAHTGGTATCTSQAICTVCGHPYGDLKPHSFTAENADAQYLKTAATCTEQAVYYKSCAVCGLSSEGTADEATFQSGGVLGHDFGAWTSNGDGTHTRTCSRDALHTETENCSGGTADCHSKAVCDVCGADYGELDASNHTGGTEIRNAADATCTVDGYTGDTYCNGCNAVLTHGTVLPATGHSGGTASCHSMAMCIVCGASYGEPDATNHVNLTHVDATAATVDAEGNTEYWHCPDCDRYFSDAAATKAIAPADTVTAKLKVEVTSPTAPAKEPASAPAPEKEAAPAVSPRTADNSNPALWLTLMGLSGGAILALAITGKKKKHSK